MPGTKARALKPEPTPELFYDEHNSELEDTETILFVHGACGSNEEWEHVIPEIVLRRYHVLLPDLPAHGKSLSIQPFTIEYATTLLLNLIEAHAKNGRAHIIGLSLGAHIAGNIAACAQPGQILSIIASGYNTIPLSRCITRVVTPVSYALHIIISFFYHPRKVLAQLRNGEYSYALFVEVARAIFRPRTLKKMRVRALVVCAASQKVRLARDSVKCAGEFFEKIVAGEKNGSRLVINYGIQHAWHIDEPRLFAEMVLAWVAEDKLPSSFVDSG